jgi:hypothetical protein
MSDRLKLSLDDFPQAEDELVENAKELAQEIINELDEQHIEDPTRLRQRLERLVEDILPALPEWSFEIHKDLFQLLKERLDQMPLEKERRHSEQADEQHPWTGQATITGQLVMVHANVVDYDFGEYNPYGSTTQSIPKLLIEASTPDEIDSYPESLVITIEEANDGPYKKPNQESVVWYYCLAQEHRNLMEYRVVAPDSRLNNDVPYRLFMRKSLFGQASNPTCVSLSIE